MGAVLLSPNFPLCPSLGNGAETERLPLNLFLGKQFSNRKHRFHRISYGFLGLFPGEEFFNWKSRLHRNREIFYFIENTWLLMFPGELKELIPWCAFIFFVPRQKTLWDCEGSTVLTCQVGHSMVQLAGQPYTKRLLHFTGNSSNSRGLAVWKCSQPAGWPLPVYSPAVCLARTLAPGCFCSKAGLDAVGEAEPGLATVYNSPSSATSPFPSHTIPGTCCLQSVPDSSFSPAPEHFGY